MTDLLAKPIIFNGAPRSGTTIISEFIFQHPTLAWPSNYQEKYPAFSSINLVRNLFDNSIWSVIGKKRQLHSPSRINRFLFTPGECYDMWEHITGSEANFRHGFLLDQRADGETADAIRQYFDRMVRYQGRERLACKLTGPARLTYLASIFPDAIFVNIRRRLVPTVRSLLKVRFWGEAGARTIRWKGAYSDDELQWIKNTSADPALVTAYQILKIRQTQQIEELNLGVHSLNIDYESFVSDPMAALRIILDYCNLSLDDRIVKYLEHNPVVDRNEETDEYFSADTLARINALKARFPLETDPVSDALIADSGR